MAFAIHWKILFKSLRAGTDYSVNIYEDGYSGSAIVLNGGASPFETQEDADEDEFAVTRLQSGYIRIVDNDYAANGSTAFNWKTFAPATDFDRPVTLTHTSGGSTIVDWQGYMQAQNFSGGLFANPQEREFPVQCILTVLGAKDIDYTQKEVQTFAYLINEVFTSIGITTSSSPIGIRYIYFQGGEFARCWLLKLIDWQNFVNDDGDGNLSARFDMLTVLQDICRFWGWTARTCGKDVYFTCADDQAGAPGFLRLTLAQLQSIANGTDTTVGTVVNFSSVTLTGDIFASTNNEDMIMRGASVAVVTADPGSVDDTMFQAYPEYVRKQMIDGGWGNVIEYRAWQGGHGGEWVTVWTKYTTNITTIQTNLFSINCLAYSSLNLAQYSQTESDVRYGTNSSYQCVIATQLCGRAGTTLMQMETIYHHVFDGDFSIKGDMYWYGYKAESVTSNEDPLIVMRFGIGETRGTAVWYDGNFGWSSSQTTFNAYVCYTDSQWRFGPLRTTTIYVPQNSNGKMGKVFIDIIGCDHFDDDRHAQSNDVRLDIVGFSLEYNRFGIDITTFQTDIKLNERKEYKASNGNMSRQNWNADCIYASGVDMSFAFGLVFNPANLRPLSNAEYMSGDEAPEQHLADRVAGYWAASKRMITAELRTDVVGSITPDQMITIDSTECHPISISRIWRDDVTNVSLLEMP